LKGTLIVVPIVNSFGFINRSRYLPDRRDLNRSFPGSEEGGSLAARLAHLFMTEIVARADLGIDLHSAAIHRMNYPAGAGLGRRRAPYAPCGCLRRADRHALAAQGRVPPRGGEDGRHAVLLYEAGEGLRFDEVSVRAGLAGILSVLKELGMITRGVAPAKARRSIAGRASGCARRWAGSSAAFRTDGERCARTTAGLVSDPFGERERDRALFDGIIVGARSCRW
jgi:predicted deacylase